jgi:hypothetical protein
VKEYHKIVTVYERDHETKFRTLREGVWATPELSYLHSLQWLWSEKIDGTNIRVKWDGDKVEFGGKSDNAQLYTPLLTWMQSKFYAGALGRIFKEPVCLYGEGFGAGIQGGGKFRADTVFILFDVLCGHIWLKREDVHDIANQLEIEVVKLVGTGPLPEAIALTKAGISSSFGDCMAEGLVMRPSVELCDRRGNRIITKIKTKDFA